MAAPTAPALKEALRFWWIRNGEKAGLVIAITLFALLGLAILSLKRGDDPFIHTGVVTGFGSSSTDTGTEIYARVYVDRRTTSVQIDAPHNCVVGSPIALRKFYVGSGEFYAVDRRGCGPAMR